MASPEAVAAPHGDFYENLFRQLNSYGKEEIDAALIAAFLKGARGVGVAQLSQVWEIASDLSGCKNRGALNRLGVFMCFKLIAAIQQGYPLSASVLSAPLPVPPNFGGPSPSAAASFSTPPPQFGPSKSPSISAELGQEGTGQQQAWPIGVEEQHKYDAIFESLGPIGGKLGGDQCKPVLLNSQLPKTLLAKIWELADMDSDGFLDRPEFCVALHLVYKALQNEPIPDQLPPALIPPFKKAFVQRRMSTRSVEPHAHPHPPPLSWSSRASSIASLNIAHQPMGIPPPISPPVPPTPSQQIGKMPSLFDRNVEEWRVEDIAQYEGEFARLDTDGDGLVGGTDVRDVFLRSGLPQQTLARIWAHVDVAKIGKLNMEQYAKCVELIRECQHPPAHQPDHSSQGATAGTPSSPPASSANLARRDSQLSNATNNSSTGGGTAKAENQRVAELNAEMEEIQRGRRKAEEELFQAEADLKVKNSEIRNLEIESLTLNATVKQLKNQRVEANKRLNDLDKKIERMEKVCAENRNRLAEDEERLDKTKTDIENAKQNSQAEEEMLAKLRAEVQSKRDQREAARAKLQAENAKFEGFVDELTQLERGMAKNEAESARMKAEMAEMERILAEAEKGDEGAKRELVERLFGQQQVPNGVGGSRSGSVDAKAHFGAGGIKTNNDPFSGGSSVAADPFAGNAQQSSAPQQFANFANFSAFA